MGTGGRHRGFKRRNSLIGTVFFGEGGDAFSGMKRNTSPEKVSDGKKEVRACRGEASRGLVKGTKSGDFYSLFSVQAEKGTDGIDGSA